MDFVMDCLVKPIAGLVRDFLLKHVLYALRVGDNVEALRRQADNLKDKCETVENEVDVQVRGTSKKCKPEVRRLLERAQDILGDSQKVKEDYEKRSCMLGTSCSLNCRSNHSISTRAMELRQRVEEELKLIGEVKDFVQEMAPPPVQEVNMSAPAAGGQLEALLEKALSFIRDDEEKKGTLGIWGMGGVGKTTLLKLINNSLKSHNYVVVFVVASSGCTEEKLQGLVADNQRISKGGNVSNKIFEFLKTRDFVLLVDDLWEPLNLEDVGIPHPLGMYGGHKRKVILTTRRLSVCGKMGANSNIITVECLKWDEAWAFFRKNVGDDLLNFNPQIMELAQKVARECDGLPLALITVARAMALKDAVKVWEDALDKLSTSRMLEITDIDGTTGTTKNPISLLKVSYDYLPNATHRLKDCFLHCALWPEDCAIKKDDLIECWMGHGLLQDRFDNIGEVYREGHVIIDALLKACLLEKFEEGPNFTNLKNSLVKMHDLTRDMALWVARDCGANKKKWLVSDNKIETATEGTDKISFMSVEVRISMIGNLSNITTLIIRGIGLNGEDVANIQFCSLLKYLDLSDCWQLKSFPVEICRLDKLEYLNLSYNDGMASIPEEAKLFVNLKYLYLRVTAITSIPFKVLKSLEKLLVLDISGGNVDQSEIINQLGDTSTRLSLKALGINVSTKLEFDKLVNLSSVSMTTLRIKDMENTSTIHLLSDNFLGKPHMHSNLKYLTISNCRALEHLVLDQGGRRMGTETLSLDGLEVLKEIIWREVRPWDVLPNLRELIIYDCHGLENVSWVALLPCLEILGLMDCRSLRCIIGEEEQVPPVGAVAFPSLRGLQLRGLQLGDLPNLRSISEQELAFPSLEFVIVGMCPLLEKLLPFGSGSASFSAASSYFPRLQRILGEKSWWDSLELEDNLRTSLLPFFISLCD